MATKEKAVVMVGKEGVTSFLLGSFSQAIGKRELVKVSILKTSEIDSNEIAIDLCASSKAELVQKIGHTLVFYKPAKEKKIILP